MHYSFGLGGSSLDHRRREEFPAIFTMLNFIANSPITYEVVVVNRKEAPDKITLSGRLGREISRVIEKHKAFFDSFDKIIVYYDNGQIELGAILNTVFSIHFTHVEFRKAEPQKYRLLQAADFSERYEVSVAGVSV